MSAEQHGPLTVCEATFDQPIQLGLQIEKRSSALGHPDRRLFVDDDVDQALLVLARERDLARRCIVGEARAALLRLAAMVTVLDVDDRRARAVIAHAPSDFVDSVRADLAIVARSLVRERSALSRGDHTPRLSEQWALVARQLAGRFDPAREELIIDNQTGQLRIWTELGPDGWRTRARFSFATELPLSFELGPRGARSLWERWRHGARTGDPDFDKRFSLRGDPHALSPDTRKQLLTLWFDVHEVVLDRTALRVIVASVVDSAEVVHELVDRINRVVGSLVPERSAKSAYR